MKNINYTLILSILLFGLQNRLLGQTRPEEQKVSLTPGGIFDEVADRFGNRYQLSEISIYSTKTFGNASINSLPTQSCNAGYFRLFFAPGSQFSQNATARAVLCGVFSDISSFIISPLSSSTVMVNVFCDDVPPSASQLGVLGSASDVSMFAPFPTNTNQGIVNSAVRYTIQSGQDIFSTFPVSLYSQANAYYHAYVNANLSNITWNFSTTTPTITNTEFDFYSVMLHEVCHALGFYSMIDGSGFSKLGQNNNYFSLYDKFLFDANGNPLLAGPTLSCSNSNLTFQTATTTIAPGCNTATPSQTTNCSTGCKYIGNYSNTITVYTPDCFSSSSSLSHFEDMCTYPTSFTTSCVPTPTAPGYNNLYYVMSDGQSPGSCYIKRFLKEDERLVFCDLGYQVSDTYSISGTLVKTYSGGTCTPVSIIGTNDGFSNNVYSIVSTGTSQVVLYSALLSNDSPNTGLTVSCIEAVYSNATVTAGTSDMTVTAAPGAGLTIIKYYPRNSSGQLGNATYVFVYFASGTCSPPNTCNMIQNGSFESTSGQACGIIGPSTFTWNSQVSCWDAYFGTPDLYFRGCNTTPGQNLGTNVDGMIPALDSWNGAPNDHIIHFGITVLPPSIYGSESIYNNLSVALIPGQTYQLSMLVCNYAGPAIINYNPNSSSVVITAASDVSMPSPPLGIYPGNLNVLAEFTVPAVTTPSWTALTATFVFNPTNNLTHSVFHLGGDGLKTSLAGGIFPVIGAAKVYVDELSLIPIPTVTFNIPQNTLTVNNTLTNLAQYASSVPGSFSGAGVTVATGTAGPHGPARRIHPPCLS